MAQKGNKTKITIVTLVITLAISMTATVKADVVTYCYSGGCQVASVNPTTGWIAAAYIKAYPVLDSTTKLCGKQSGHGSVPLKTVRFAPDEKLLKVENMDQRLYPTSGKGVGLAFEDYTVTFRDRTLDLYVGRFTNWSTHAKRQGLYSLVITTTKKEKFAFKIATITKKSEGWIPHEVKGAKVKLPEGLWKKLADSGPLTTELKVDTMRHC